MDKEFVKQLAVSTAGVMKDLLAAAIAPLTGRVDELQRRLDGIRIPEAIKGDKGDFVKGDVGEPGISAYQVACANGFVGTEKEWLESLQGPKGPKGDPGQSVKGDKGESIKGDIGLSAYQIARENGFIGLESDWLKSLIGAKGDKGDSIKGDPGLPGKDGQSIKGEPGPRGHSAYEVARTEGFNGTEKQWLESLKGIDGKPGLNGKDADPIHPDTVALMVSKEVTAAVAAIPKPQDGKPGDPGRDALQLDILPGINPQKSVPRGTFALHDGGILMARRQTTPAETIDWDEWAVAVRGVSRLEWKQDETDERRFTIKSILTGEESSEQQFRIPVLVHKGRFIEGTVYEKGDVVRWNRSSFVCQADKTLGVPEISKDWQVLAQRGDRGNDGKDLEPPKPMNPIRFGSNGGPK